MLEQNDQERQKDGQSHYSLTNKGEREGGEIRQEDTGWFSVCHFLGYKQMQDMSEFKGILRLGITSCPEAEERQGGYLKACYQNSSGLGLS